MVLSLKTKSLAFIALLALLELVFVGLLFKQLELAETAASKEAAAKEIYIHSQAVVRGLYSAHEQVWAFNNELTAAAEADLRKTMDALLGELLYLNEHCKSKRMRSKLSKLNTATKDLVETESAWVKRIKAAPEMEKQSVILSCQDDLRPRKKVVQGLAIEFLKTQQSELDSTSPQSLLEKNLSLIILLGIAGNVLLAISLWLFFFTDLTKRLAKILTDVELAGKGISTTPAMKGNDEIALLDQSIQEMASQLKAYENLRHSYVGLLKDDLSSPLHHVLQTIEKMKDLEEIKQASSSMKILGTAERNLSRLVGIVDELSLTNSIAPPELKLQIVRASTVEIIERSIEAVRGLASKKNIELVNNSVDLNVDVDANKLVQVIVNLISNAIKFSPEGARIYIASDASVNVTAANMVKFEVVDEGRGIPKEKIQGLFEKFQQVDASDGQRGVGTGLGLNLCKQIVELHGGTISAESEPGNGSKFWFVIPSEQSTLSSSVSTLQIRRNGGSGG